MCVLEMKWKQCILQNGYSKVCSKKKSLSNLILSYWSLIRTTFVYIILIKHFIFIHSKKVPSAIIHSQRKEKRNFEQKFQHSKSSVQLKIIGNKEKTLWLELTEFDIIEFRFSLLNSAKASNFVKIPFHFVRFQMKLIFDSDSERTKKSVMHCKFTDVNVLKIVFNLCIHHWNIKLSNDI